MPPSQLQFFFSCFLISKAHFTNK
uniref:Uncharacterized protein n=1 Tax=Anguilla anguilla TaxID=7936 RepID=A0A0E9W8T1_ANGAN